MNYFPNGDEEIELVKFIARYQYLRISDASKFFASKKYYRNRIKSLIDKKILRRIKWNLVLGEFGIEYVKQLNCEYNKLNRNKKYMERLLRISNLAAYYHNCKTIEFTPSFSIKDKECFTITGRRFIGTLYIKGYKYLVYYISENNDKKYITSVIYDIEREMNFGNIIVFVNDINRIHMEDFATGHNSTIIIEDNEENREKLKYLNIINWYKVIKKYFKENLSLSEYDFCDYTDYKSKYISYFQVIDVEKIWRIKSFLQENENGKYKTATIICNNEIENILRRELPNAEYIVIDSEKYTDKYINVWLEDKDGLYRCEV